MSASAGYAVHTCAWSDAADALRSIRRDVFVVEQGVPEAVEWDVADAPAVHALAETPAGVPIGCARLLADGHIGRVAVVHEWRSRGVGTALLRLMIDEARARGHRIAIVNAQVDAMRFYVRQGFVASGREFEEAGIAHRVMTRALR